MTYDDEPPYEEGLTPSESGGRVPPQDNAAEQSLLGSMLLNPDAIIEAIEHVKGADFYRPAHEIIFETALDLYMRSEPVDAITVVNALIKDESLMKVGGAPYIHTLTSVVPVATNATYYARIIAEKAALRRLIEAGTKIVQRGYTQSGEVTEAFDASMADLNAAMGPGAAEDYLPIAEILEPTLDAMESHTAGEMLGVPTGFYDLDDLTNGLKPGQMIVLAGRPAMGKSTLATDFVRSASIRHNMCSAYFSLEMSRDELTRRIISAESKVALAKINSGLLSEQDWVKIAQRMDPIFSAPLFIDDSPNLTMTEIAAKARRLKAKHDLKMMVVDYLQLMTSGKRVENRQAEVSEFSRQIKLLAKELEVPVVALSQLNRGPEQRTTKRPVLSDLRESGAIEQDADVVILLHREDMYEVESSRPGEADLILAKHRNGPTRDVTVAFQGHYSRFVDMAS